MKTKGAFMITMVMLRNDDGMTINTVIRMMMMMMMMMMMKVTKVK